MRYKAEVTLDTKEKLTCWDCRFWLNVPVQDVWESVCMLTGEDIQGYICGQRGSISDMCPFKLIGDSVNDET